MSEPAAGGDARPLPLFARPWFWILVVGALWVIPLVKSLGAELPDPLPGMDGPVLEIEGVAEDGRTVALGDLAGYLVLVGTLSLADEDELERTLERQHRLRKRLRGLGSSVVYLTLVAEHESEPLARLLDERGLRRPTQVYLPDGDGEVLRILRDAAADPVAEYFLLDTHGRLRGAYGTTSEALDRLVGDSGQLANWRGSDPPLSTPAGD